MARTYAGILGPLAFLTSLVRGVVHDGSTESVLMAACGSLLVFAVIGCAVGWLAERIVEESVRGRISAELSADESAEVSEAPAGADA